MPSYLVESYLPRSRADELQQAVVRARLAAEALTAEGKLVLYLRSAYLPGDELCQHLFEAESAGLAGEASRRAGISFERVVELVHVPLPSNGRVSRGEGER